MQCGRPPQQRTGRQVHRPLRLLDRRIGKGRAFVAYAAALRLGGRSESALESDRLSQLVAGTVGRLGIDPTTSSARKRLRSPAPRRTDNYVRASAVPHGSERDSTRTELLLQRGTLERTRSPSSGVAQQRPAPALAESSAISLRQLRAAELRLSSGGWQRDGLPGSPSRRGPVGYGCSRLKYWLASFGANACPNSEAKSTRSWSSPM